VKGYFCEILVKELFFATGYDVVQYGMEHVLPTVVRKMYTTDYGRIKDTETGIALRRMPDLVVQDPEEGDIQLIDVKFRANGQLPLSAIDQYAPHTVIILVSPISVQALTVEEYNQGKSMTTKTKHNLSSRGDLFPRFDPEHVENLESQVIDYAKKIVA
tara:strand:- start:154 stop:630 length:477 start_codon:yes stop_codon:yes gene_type:complete